MNNFRSGLGATPRSRRFMLETMLGTGAALAMPDLLVYAAAASPAGGVKLKNPYLQAIATDALDQLKYAFTAAAAGVPGNGNTFADSCRRFVASRKPARQASLRTIATQTLARPANVRTAMFGKYAATDAASFMATNSHVMALKVGVAPRPANFTIDTTPPDQGDDMVHFDPDGFLSDAEIKAKEEKEEHDAFVKQDKINGEPYKHMEIRLYEVKITTGTGDSGDTEEVAMGGCCIGATGHIAKIKPFMVADDFDTDSDDRQHKSYYNIQGWHLGWFDVRQEKPFPHYYTAQLSMAELDNGGFGDFLIDLWNKVKDVVKGLIDDALSSVLGPIGYALGEIIGAFLDWFIGLFHNEDDILGVKHLSMRFNSHRYSRYKALDLLSDRGHKTELHYTGYHATIGWKLMTDQQYEDRKKRIKSHRAQYNQAEQDAQ